MPIRDTAPTRGFWPRLVIGAASDCTRAAAVKANQSKSNQIKVNPSRIFAYYRLFSRIIASGRGSTRKPACSVVGRTPTPRRGCHLSLLHVSYAALDLPFPAVLKLGHWSFSGLPRRSFSAKAGAWPARPTCPAIDFQRRRKLPGGGPFLACRAEASWPSREFGVSLCPLGGPGWNPVGRRTKPGYCPGLTGFDRVWPALTG